MLGCSTSIAKNRNIWKTAQMSPVHPASIFPLTDSLLLHVCHASRNVSHLLISLAFSIYFNRIDSKHSVLDFVNNIFKVIIVYYAVTPFLSRALNFSHIIEKYVNYVDVLSFSPRKQELSRTSTSPIKL